MPRNTTVTLDDHFDAFIERAVASGRYGSASDVVRAGLRLLEAEEERLDGLRAEIAKGEKSGKPEPFEFDAFLQEMHRKCL